MQIKLPPLSLRFYVKKLAGSFGSSATSFVFFLFSLAAFALVGSAIAGAIWGAAGAVAVGFVVASTLIGFAVVGSFCNFSKDIIEDIPPLMVACLISIILSLSFLWEVVQNPEALPSISMPYIIGLTLAVLFNVIVVAIHVTIKACENAFMAIRKYYPVFIEKSKQTAVQFHQKTKQYFGE